MIVVTGMHRSGSSSIANLLLELGVSLGDPAGFYRADEWNPRGYYEQVDVIDLNSRALTGFTYCQGPVKRRLSQLVYVSQPGERARRRRFQAIRQEAAALSAKYQGVAVKDPRFCLTLGLWREVAQVESCVVCLRHPLDAAGSLERRNRIPLGRGLRFWNYHVRALLPALDGLKVLAIDYGRLLSAEADAELASIAAFFQLDPSQEARRAAHGRVFERGLRHLAGGDDQALPPETQALWDRLLALRPDAP